MMKKLLTTSLALVVSLVLMEAAADDIVKRNPGGETEINTTEISKNVRGYAGPVPLLITLEKGKIKNIRLLPNRETPRYLRRVQTSGLLQKWNGMKAADAEKAEVDAATGATYTSRAVITNVRDAMKYVRKNKVK